MERLEEEIRERIADGDDDQAKENNDDDDDDDDDGDNCETFSG